MSQILKLMDLISIFIVDLYKPNNQLVVQPLRGLDAFSAPQQKRYTPKESLCELIEKF